MRQIVGGRAVDGQAASTVQMKRFETDILVSDQHREALADLTGQWIDAMHDAQPPRWTTLDMDSSVNPTHGEQEGAAWNSHFGCKCYRPLFLFNQFSDLERCALRKGNDHGADGWNEVLAPFIARYRTRDLMRFCRADAGFANHELYERLEEEGYSYIIRLNGNRVLQGRIAHLLRRPVGRPPNYICRFYHAFEYQAASWGKARRVIANVEWHPGELFPRVGFVVTSLPREPDWIIRFFNQRGMIKIGRRLSVMRARSRSIRQRWL